VTYSTHGEVYSIQTIVIKVVSDLRQLEWFYLSTEVTLIMTLSSKVTPITPPDFIYTKIVNYYEIVCLKERLPFL